MNEASQLPDPDERQEIVFRALRDLIQSDAFRRSARIIRFLEYVVIESLSAAPRLTEKVIGIVVFDRPKDWDPKLDPIVRIEARRLREKLEQYYVSDSTEQSVVMSLPKGGYKISFDLRATQPRVNSIAFEDPSETVVTERPLDTHDKHFGTKLTTVSLSRRRLF